MALWFYSVDGTETRDEFSICSAGPD